VSAWLLGPRALLLLLLLTPQRGLAQAPVCTNFAMFNEYFGPTNAAQARVCPPPSAAVPLPAATARALDPDAPPPSNPDDERAIIDGLHALSEIARNEPPWGADFANRLDAFLQAFTPNRCDEPLPLQFTELHATTDADAACECAFEASSEGNPGYACFRVPPAPACAIAGLPTYDLAGAPAAARAFRILTLTSAATKRLQAGCAKLAVDTLQQAKRHWHTLLGEGYVQYPWELWISRQLFRDFDNYSRCFASDSSCTGLEGLEPEPVRPIFLHPGVGLGFSGFGKHDGKPSSRADLVVLLELAGVVGYASDFENYLGVSAILGFQRADFARPRVGLLLHLSHYLQLGYLLGLVKETRLNGTLYLSIDLIGLTNRSVGLTPQAL
jgi:hypothetical protein